MGKIKSFTVIVTCLVLFLGTLNAQWAKTYGGIKDDYGYGSQQTSDGGYIVAGHTVSFGVGGGDYWILKLNANGDIQWQHTYGGNAWDCAYPIQQTTDGGYIIAGETYSFGAGKNDLWLLKLDSAGAILWQRTFGGTGNEYPFSLQQTQDGGYIIAGTSSSFRDDSQDFWIIKVKSTGIIDWQRMYGGSEKESPYSIHQLSDGGYIVAGETGSFGAGDFDFWLVKLNSKGSIDWQRTLGGSGYERAYFIQQTDDNGYILAGSTDSFGAGGDDFWVLKLNSTGTITWQYTYGGSKHERAHCIRQTRDGGYIVTGYTFSFGIGEANVWVLKLNSKGKVQWQNTFGKGHFNDPNLIQEINGGGYIISGLTDSFGAGKWDALIIKLDENGEIDSSCNYTEPSNISASETNVSPQDTQVVPYVTNVSPQDTGISPKDSDANTSLICGCTTTTISLSVSKINMGAIISGEKSRDQQIFIVNKGCGTLEWSISEDEEWLSCSPISGTGFSTVTVSVNASGLSAGTYTGTITVSDANASNSPQTVTVTLVVYGSGQATAPFGTFETPVDGSTVFSSIPVTGWVLDDIGVDCVKIYRPDGKNQVYIGNAVFVEGARPDVQAAYPGYPMNQQAGWGYMLLTNFLPHGGNGTYTLFARAKDIEGHEVTLGSKTITVDNANAVKPFGAIDTPSQGGLASGSNFVNWGWVLTPQPNSIPADGYTINVWIDGVNVGHPNYNFYRSDIAKLFPDFANTDGAVGYFYLDTTAYDNSVHTIQWTAKDTGGNTDGIGSRYFKIQNTGSDAKASLLNDNCLMLDEKWAKIPSDYTRPVLVQKGFEKVGYENIISADDNGECRIKIKEMEPLRIKLSEYSSIVGCYQMVGDSIKKMAIGMTLRDNEVNWMPGVGYLGNYRFVVVIKDKNGNLTKQYLNVTIEPKFTTEK